MPDIDSKKLAYEGMSQGALLGAIIPAVEERFKASVYWRQASWGKGAPKLVKSIMLPV